MSKSKRQHWVAITMLLSVAWSSPGRAADGTLAQTTVPDVDAKPAFSRPGMTLAPAQPAAPPSCIKQIYGSTYLIQQPVLSTQYFAIAAATMVPGPAKRNDNQTEFGLSASEAFIAPEEIWAFATVNLPHGAMIREISATIYDSSGIGNLQVSLSKRMRDQLNSSARILTLESDCASIGTFATMSAANFAIPFDSKFAHVIKVSVVPVKTPATSLAPAMLSISEIRVGYTLR